MGASSSYSLLNNPSSKVEIIKAYGYCLIVYFPLYLLLLPQLPHLLRQTLFWSNGANNPRCSQVPRIKPLAWPIPGLWSLPKTTMQMSMLSVASETELIQAASPQNWISVLLWNPKGANIIFSRQILWNQTSTFSSSQVFFLVVFSQYFSWWNWIFRFHRGIMQWRTSEELA